MRAPPLPNAFLAGFIVAAALWLALFASAFGVPTSTSHWIHDVVARKEAIAQRMEGPRVIVAGGSGALFGVRASVLSRELGLPVVNAGVHAGLGLEYLLHEVERIARRGDTVVLALEYDLYMRRDDDDTLIDYVISRDPEYFRRLSMLREVRWFLRMPVERLANPFLMRVFGAPTAYPDHLNAYGDVVGNNSVFKTDALRSSVGREPLRIRPPAPGAVELLQDFSAWARERGIHVLATHPNTIRFPEYFTRPTIGRDLASIDSLHAASGIPFVDRWPDTMMDVRWFFDSPYHLDNVGATLRSRELAGRLREHVAGIARGPAYEPPLGKHGLDIVDARFWRLEPLSGFGTMENVWTGRNEPFIPAVAPRSKAVIRTAQASPARLVARLRAASPQQVQVLIGAKTVAHWMIGASGAFQRFETEVQLADGDNVLTLVKTSDAPVDIAEWRVDLPADAASGPPTAAR